MEHGVEEDYSLSLCHFLNFGHCYFPLDLAQGDESFDFAQDREPVERLVESFDICDL